MEPFPKLLNKQVALLGADAKTGHFLDESFKIAINDTRRVYSVFDSYEVAGSKIAEMAQGHPNTEFVIYGANQTLMKLIAL